MYEVMSLKSPFYRNVDIAFSDHSLRAGHTYHVRFNTDTLNPQVPHLKARDTTLMLVSRAPLDRLLAYRDRMGWNIPWASTAGNDFNHDVVKRIIGNPVMSTK